MTTGTSAVLAFGSNLGDRAGTISEALSMIFADGGIEVMRFSILYETPAVKPDGIDPDAPLYLNGAAVIRTTLGAYQLLELVNRIEGQLGRVRAERWGDRTIDIDIVTYGDMEQSDPDLTLPHPRAAERDFVLVPWLEIDPDARLPGVGRVRDILDGLPASGIHPAAATTP